MASLNQIFKNYTGVLRQFKAVYVLNNLLNRHKLAHNRELYAKYGLKKSIYAPLGKADFAKPHPDVPWLDRPDAIRALEQHPRFKEWSAPIQEELKRFVRDGYMILKNFFSIENVDRLNEEIDQLLQDRSIDFNYTGRKVMESFRVSPMADAFFRNRQLNKLLSFTMGAPVIPFQTINFIRGSEQRAHSDSIHMTTEPQGYLIAAWIALEDIGPDQGPLEFYPGSHRLPFVSTQQYASGNTNWTIGSESNKRYEDKIAQIVAENDLQPKTFLAQKGDILIWHANLIHGGQAITREGATRKSMVAHYFCEGVICYHEMSQRPALIEKR
ncbi:phytanoyl-CoA dioxygenase family protein [Flavilitoribacter nigricans]|nr:phytanoyl-CoA dioxygenase family protein [Flavilitoribacter nigricans]